jgi:hypothetical protein
LIDETYEEVRVMKKRVVMVPLALGALLLVGGGKAVEGGYGINDAPRKLLNTDASPSTHATSITYAAIFPPKSVRPLSETVSSSLKQDMPLLEAEAFDTEHKSGDNLRSVPLGQTLMAGEKDLSDGPLKKYRLVTFYGTPLSSQMGVLGESTPDEMMQQLKKQTEAYSIVDPSRPAVPTIELVASVAQRDPGSNGLYVSWTPKSVIERYAELAKNNKALLMLDVQLGRDSVMDEVKALSPFLKLPYVELAIDTEFHVGPGEVPGENLGQVDGSDIQHAIEFLNKLVKEENIPDKVVMIHEFQKGIVTHKSLIKPTNHVEVVLNADGFGTPFDKLANYHTLVRNEPIQYGGFKLFYSEDRPLLSPKEVVSLDPAPAIVDYQ